MGIGVSLILIAAGAILAFAVHASSSTFNVQAIGADAFGGRDDRSSRLVGVLVELGGFGRDRETNTTAVERQAVVTMPLAIAGTGYGLIGLLVIILLVVMIFYFARRA